MTEVFHSLEKCPYKSILVIVLKGHFRHNLHSVKQKHVATVTMATAAKDHKKCRISQ